MTVPNEHTDELRAAMIAALPGVHPWGDAVDRLLSGPLAPLLRERDTLRAFMLDNQQQFGYWCVDRALAGER